MDQMSSEEEALMTVEAIVTTVAEEEQLNAEQRQLNVNKLMIAAYPDVQISMAEELQLLREKDRLLSAVRKGHKLSPDEEKLITVVHTILDARELATILDQVLLAIEKARVDNLQLLRRREQLVMAIDGLSPLRQRFKALKRQIRVARELVTAVDVRSLAGVEFIAETLQRLSETEQRHCLDMVRIERQQAEAELQVIAIEQWLKMGRYLEDHLNRLMLLDFNEERSSVMEEHFVRIKKLQEEIDKLESTGEHLELIGLQSPLVTDELDVQYEHLQKVSEFIHLVRAQLY